jgi:hypothetical protein
MVPHVNERVGFYHTACRSDTVGADAVDHSYADAAAAGGSTLSTADVLPGTRSAAR